APRSTRSWKNGRRSRSGIIWSRNGNRRRRSPELLPPKLQQRPALAVDRIAFRQRHVGNREQRLGVFRLAAAAEIVTPLRRISPDHQEIGTRPQALMPGARR